MKKNGILGHLYLILIMIFLYAPIAVLIIFSFNATKSRSVWAGFSLQWYIELFQDSELLSAVYVTLLCAIIATVISTFAGTFASVGFMYMKVKPRAFWLRINDIPVINADITMGVSLCLLFVAAGTFTHLNLGFGTMLIAHITFDIPYVILSVRPKLLQMDPNLMNAAQDLGCTWFRGFRKVVLPEISPGIINGALIAFTMSIDDFIISYFTAGSEIQNLSMLIFSMTRKRISPEVNAISALLFFIIIILLIIINLRQTLEFKRKNNKDVLIPVAMG